MGLSIISEPSFVNCPAHFVEASVRKNSDIALLPEMQLAAKDYKGETLGVCIKEEDLT